MSEHEITEAWFAQQYPNVYAAAQLLGVPFAQYRARLLALLTRGQTITSTSAFAATSPEVRRRVVTR